ncbi:heparan-alpha-glucosaminide N-acetyltransferase domain-containing protein [soil metagenome]
MDIAVDYIAVDPIERRSRIIDLDVTRAVGLIGVCVMNFHGYLINDGADYPPRTFVERIFDPWRGPLSTRFAAVFVIVAGMGITLLSRRSREGRDPAAISVDRWKLTRRGVLLFAFGYFLDWVWPGTILFYYGAFFMVGALLFTLRSRWLIAIGVAAALAAAGLQRWSLQHDARWLLEGSAGFTRSPRDLVFDTFLRGTHPLLPWLLFLCAGMVLGRLLPFSALLRVQLMVTGTAFVVLGYLGRSHLPWAPMLRSTAPFDRGLLYCLTTIGSSVVAVCLIGWLAELSQQSYITRALAAAGRMTLTLYVGHVLTYNVFVHKLQWVVPDGLGTALFFALCYWIIAIITADAWLKNFELGPLEWVYRKFSA